MNTHLNHEELTGLLLGTAANGAASHLRACAECSRELDEMKKSIGLFRQATRDWSDSEISAPLSAHRSRLSLPTKNSRPFAGWLFAAAAIVLLVIPSLYLMQHIHKSTTPANVEANNGSSASTNAALDPAQQLAQDNALLSQVDSAIAEGVPPSLAPLQLSSSQASSSGTSNSGTSKSSTSKNTNAQETSSPSR
jgi:anti-sigma factor RsiW